jgi:hypothetical protein
MLPAYFAACPAPGKACLPALFWGIDATEKMEPESVNTRPLGQRIRDLADDVSALRKAIHDELDWRQKNHSVDIEDWDDDQ